MTALWLAMTVALVLTASPTARGDTFRPTRLDHQAHMAVSYSLALTGALIAEHKVGLDRKTAVLVASLATLAVGGFKELVIDDPGEGGDMVANVIGTAGAAAVVFVFRF